MKPLKFLSLGIIGILSCSTIYLSIENSNGDHTIIKAVNALESCMQMQDALENQLLTITRLSEIEIDPEIKVISPSYDTLTLSEIIEQDEYYLVYKFNIGDCIECINQQFDLMKELRSEKIKVICLYSYNNPRELRAVNEKYKQFSIYGDFQNLWPLKMQSYLLLSPNLKPSHFFIPNISQTTLTKSYFEMVTE